MNIMEYIRPELLILVPVLNFIGVMIKESNLSNKWILPSLCLMSIALSAIWMLSNNVSDNTLTIVFMSITQGVIVTMIASGNADKIKNAGTHTQVTQQPATEEVQPTILKPEAGPAEYMMSEQPLDRTFTPEFEPVGEPMNYDEVMVNLFPTNEIPIELAMDIDDSEPEEIPTKPEV